MPSPSTAWRRVIGVSLLLPLVSIGCGDGALRVANPEHPWVVVALDGADWDAIEPLWKRGQLPHLRALAKRGARVELGTDYAASPVIWNTVATGVIPARHGITDFVLPTAQGDLPVSSTMRKVPAIWNMASLTGLRVAVLGWWASWPAEEVEGVVVADRVQRASDGLVWPPSREVWLEEELRRVGNRAGEPDFPRLPYDRDNVMAHLAEDLVGERFDLLMVYLRSIDVESHYYWKYFQPDSPRYSGVDPEELQRYGDRVPAAYRAVDAAIGRLRAAAPPDANFLVLSDHGFHPVRERYRIVSDLDPLLERLGFLVRERDGAIDFSRTLLYTYATAGHKTEKKLRYPTAGREPGGAVPMSERPAIRRRLQRVLEQIEYSGGEPAFRVRSPSAAEQRNGADLIVRVQETGATPELRLDGEPVGGVISSVHTITGSHGFNTRGMLVAAGPDVAEAAALDGMTVHDITPTLLYGLGLPVAEDFDGKAWLLLFRPEFRARHPLRTIPTWGQRATGEARATEADAEIVQELRALGYLD